MNIPFFLLMGLGLIGLVLCLGRRRASFVIGSILVGMAAAYCLTMGFDGAVRVAIRELDAGQGNYRTPVASIVSYQRLIAPPRLGLIVLIFGYMAIAILQVFRRGDAAAGIAGSPHIPSESPGH